MSSYLEYAIVHNSINWIQSDITRGRIKLIDNGLVSSKPLFSSGTGISQVNMAYHNIQSGGIIYSIDLANLTRTLLDGTIITSFSGGDVKGFIIKNLSTGDNILFSVSTGVSQFNNPFDKKNTNIIISPQCSFSIFSLTGWKVSNNRFMTLSGPNVYYEIGIIGVVTGG